MFHTPGEHYADAEFPRRLGIRLVDPVEHNACVGYDGVDVAELLDALVERGGQRLAITDIGLAPDHLPAGLLDQVHRLVQVLGCGHRVQHAVELPTDVHPDDVGALLGQPDRVRTPLSPRRSRDEGDATVHSAHG